MLSKKAKYGLKAMFYLAKQFGKGPVLISDLAEEEHIPKKFLELILLELKKNGLLHSKMGKGGGYYLNKPPGEVTVGQVVRILDGPLAPIPCVSKTAYRKCDECENEKTCEIRKIMMQVREASATILDHTSLLEAPKALFTVARKNK
ncbi:MAG TPA: Rrf2 family transcriptional regulator [Chitinophagales bacterium]|nr:Rrf2 family transcriptional regulator [Chitinophagales bacterium]HMX03870.1 Rrf2 family transcriptional regulator [Chitinophagales bacterium]HMZ90650.1 Rrf2 family transcriptional regulator [Chitinophagales bacterium]HNA57183.1 Rrf2 family transcriptional regulator [Chitinophagales bacterium]HNE45593.1 Rrf2 family transcriptional regulator [Chitinophagales bacterium]